MLLIYGCTQLQTTLCVCGCSLKDVRRLSLGLKIWRSTCAATQGRNPTCVSTQDATRLSATQVTGLNTSVHTWTQWVATLYNYRWCFDCVHQCGLPFVFICLWLYRSHMRARCLAVQSVTLIPVHWGNIWSPILLKSNSYGRRQVLQCGNPTHNFNIISSVVLEYV